ncbi:MAG: gamma-glutamyl-phosphate reductase [Kiritimatiellia bacterium]|jgi:glutamate-5-semialdehyde dehydrogenase
MDKDQIRSLALKAREAQRTMLGFSSRKKRDILTAIADELERAREAILAANAEDLADSVARGRPAGFIDLLTLTESRLVDVVRAFRVIADSKDPIGEQISRWIRPNGLEIVRKRVPVGLVGIALESRPHVVPLACAVCFKVNNAVMVIGDEETRRTNEILVETIRTGGASAGLPLDALQLLCTEDNLLASRYMATLDGIVDVAIPRGGHSFVSDIMEHARIPVLRHRGGLCHVYVDCNRRRPEAPAVARKDDEAAGSLEIPKVVATVPSLPLDPSAPPDAVGSRIDLAAAVAIVVNSRCHEPFACNSASVVLVHRHIAPSFLPELEKAAAENGMTLYGDEGARSVLPGILPAEADMWRTPRRDLTLTIGIVDSIDEAVSRINDCGSHLSDSIVSEDEGAQNYFVREVDSAVVFTNASTCFADGGEFGMGAEIGLSTDKLNARGPIGLEDLTSMKYLVRGGGQTRG